MANKVLLVAKSRIEANRLAPDYGISRFTYVFGAAGVRRLVPSDIVWLLPGWEGNPAKFAIENALRYTRATVKRPAPVDAPPMQKVVHEHLEQSDAETQKVLENLGKGAQVDEAKGTVTFPVSGEIPERAFEWATEKIQDVPAEDWQHGGPLVPAPETGDVEPTPPPLPPLSQEDWDAAGIEAVFGDFSTLATNDTGKPEPVIPADTWDSIATTMKNDVEPEEPSAQTAEAEPSQDPEEAPAEVKPKVNRRRRRCKSCDELIEPDDVEAHAATHVEA